MMVDIAATTVVEAQTTVGVTVDKLDATAICLDDKNKRVIISIDFINTESDTVIATKTMILTGSSYSWLVDKAVNPNLSFSENLVSGLTEAMQAYTAGALPQSDVSLIDLDLFKLLQGIVS